jgi:hypothetical protein
MPATPYFVSDESSGKLLPVSRVVDKSPKVARAALTELLNGPGAGDRSVGIRSEIPGGTKLLGLTIKNGLATVNLSRKFEADWGGTSKGKRLAQVVYTLTRLGSVDRVAFLVEGRPSTVFSGQGVVGANPVTRDDFLDHLPNIFVDSPSYGSYTGKLNRLRVTGKSTFHAGEFRLTVFYADTGEKAVDVPVRSSCGTWCWEDFDVTVPVKATEYQRLMLQVYTPTAGGGAEDIQTYHVETGELPQPIQLADQVDWDGCGC